MYKTHERDVMRLYALSEVVTEANKSKTLLRTCAHNDSQTECVSFETDSNDNCSHFEIAAQCILDLLEHKVV